MCVIVIAEKTRPSPAQVEAMYETNKDGFGIAHRDGDKKVVWTKGLLDLPECQKLILEAPLPFVAHFRIQTVGGKKSGLCHPFPVMKDVPLNLKGVTDGYVLFHNGHWGEWRRSVLDAVFKAGRELPKGKWSDTRAMAWSAAQFGVTILEMIDEKSVVFGPSNLKSDAIQLTGSGWTEKNGMWFSNLQWEHRVGMIERRLNGWKETVNPHVPRIGANNLVDIYQHVHDDEAELPNTSMSHVPHGHKHYIDKMCVFNTCSEDRLKDERYCALHLPMKPNQDSKKPEAKKIELDGLKDMGCVKFGCNKKIDYPKNTSYCEIHLKEKNGGEPVEADPFLLLKNQLDRGEISRKQWKKARKGLEKQLMQGRSKQAIRKAQRREKKRWRMPAMGMGMASASASSVI